MKVKLSLWKQVETYMIFFKKYERETNLLVNELSKSEMSTFAKLRLISHDVHIEKGRYRKTILSERKCFLCGMAVLLRMRNISLWN